MGFRRIEKPSPNCANPNKSTTSYDFKNLAETLPNQQRFLHTWTRQLPSEKEREARAAARRLLALIRSDLGLSLGLPLFHFTSLVLIIIHGHFGADSGYCRRTAIWAGCSHPKWYRFFPWSMITCVLLCICFHFRICCFLCTASFYWVKSYACDNNSVIFFFPFCLVWLKMCSGGMPSSCEYCQVIAWSCRPRQGAVCLYLFSLNWTYFGIEHVCLMKTGVLVWRLLGIGFGSVQLKDGFLIVNLQLSDPLRNWEQALCC